jgi:selenide,water dikinase
MKGLAFPGDPNLLVGLAQPDDAGVYRLTDEIALVQTLDFFTPIVDDPRAFGRIAAANALSDVYAMGGKPLCAMNIVCFPLKDLPLEVLRAVLQGGIDALQEAGVAMAGGHSVQDPELKYGLSVTGIVHPQKIWSKQGARAGDRLVLTKPLGTGIVTTAIKAGLAGAEAERAVIASMSALNRRAAELLAGQPVHACTDVTGFGLLGHAAEMVEGTKVGLSFDSAALPVFPGVLELLRQGLAPGGLQRNLSYRSSMIDFDSNVPHDMQDLLFDPQTSGGLLVSLPPESADKVLKALHKAGIADARIVGEVLASPAGRIRVR